LNPYLRYRSPFIACKNYEETITTIHTCKIYYDVFSEENESNQEKVQKNKRILLIDGEYDVNLVMKLVLEKNGFKVDSFTDASKALEILYDLFPSVLFFVYHCLLDQLFLLMEIFDLHLLIGFLNQLCWDMLKELP
jgi:hypothetical protein